MQMSSRRAIFIAMCSIFAIFLANTACLESVRWGPPVKVVNETDIEVFYSPGARGKRTIPAGGNYSDPQFVPAEGTHPFQGCLNVYDASGEIVYQVYLTEEILRNQNWTIVVVRQEHPMCKIP